MRFRFLLGCLVLSGFSGLAYELLWTRMLALTFGSTSLSFSAVLAVFFGGLALGSWAAGRRAPRLERPVRAYAWIEIATGMFGILLYPLISHLEVVFAAVDPGAGLGGALVRLAFAAPILIVPTFLMGATLPIICAATIYRDEDSGRGMALIYGFNTLGAFLGAYAITYHLIPAFGVFRSLLITVAVNLVVGVAALLFDWRFTEASRQREASPVSSAAIETAEQTMTSTPPRSDPKVLQVASALTFFSGFAMIGLEVVWARLFSSFLQGTIYGVGAVLICFLVGIGLGSLFLARRVPANRDVGLWFAGLQTLTIGSVLLLGRSTPLIAHTLATLGGPSQSLAPQHFQLLVVFAALFLPTVCSGASFPLLVKAVESRARRTGRALGSMYASNTLGSISGSLLTGFVLIPEFGSVGAITASIACLGLSAALGGALLSEGSRRMAGLAVGAMALILVSLDHGFDSRLVAMGAASPDEPLRRYRSRYEQLQRSLVYFAEGRDATISVLDTGELRVLRINGLGQGNRSFLPPHHNLESLLVALIPFVHAREPGQALVVGLGAGTTIELLGQLGVPRVKVIELEPRVADAVEVVYRGNSPVDSDGVQLQIDDARHYLLLNERREAARYDLITSMPFHPWVAPNLYTREFFQLAKRNLSEGGVFSTWFGITRMDEAAVQSLLRAFCAVFSDYVIYFVPETGSYFLVGSNRPITIDLDRWRNLQSHPTLGEREEFSGPYFLLARLFATGNEETPPPPEGIVNTDDTAFVEVHAPRSSSTSPILRGFLPREYLQPSFIAGTEPRVFYLELLEQLLGSPGGRFALTERSIAPLRAERTLSAVKDLLHPEEVAYFEGRVALSQGRAEEARARFAAAMGGPVEIARRAAQFQAMSHPAESAARREALGELATTDAVLALLEIDTELALRRARELSPSLDEDPLGWFLWKAATGAPGPLSDEEKAVFRGVLGQQLGESDRLGLLQLAERFSREQGWVREMEMFNVRRRSVAARQTERLLAEGIAAARQGRFREAAESLWNAHRLEPGNESVTRLLVPALVETGDQDRTAALVEDLRFLGRSELYIRALLDAAREGLLSFESDATAETIPEGGGERAGPSPGSNPAAGWSKPE